MDNTGIMPGESLESIQSSGGEAKNDGSGNSDFADAMKDMEEKAKWDAFGNRIDLATEEADSEAGYDQGISDAAKIINESPLNELVLKNPALLGSVVEAIKNTVLDGSKDPIETICDQFGIDSVYEYKELQDAGEADEASEEKFRDDYSVEEKQLSRESTLAAFWSMKELILEVEDADSDFGRLRMEAEAAGMNYFEYAVKKHGKNGLTGLFEALSLEKESARSDEGSRKVEEDVREKVAMEIDEADTDEGLDEREKDGLIEEIVRKVEADTPTDIESVVEAEVGKEILEEKVGKNLLENTEQESEFDESEGWKIAA